MAQQGIVLGIVDNVTWQDFLLVFLIFWFLIAQTYYIRFSYYRIGGIHDMLYDFLNDIYYQEQSQDQAKIVRIAGDIDDLVNHLREQGFEVDNLIEEKEKQSNIDAIREWDMS